ncbi:MULTISPECIES: hypothetical protein [Streptomyces]|uniref:PE-PGRS family protein n=2 Tax=Streptomyces TaxID=1883 RepID=A0A380PA72_STRGR|nr:MULTISPECIES: hypothetical protein [Streptomyces]WPR51512.1 hypothetical protein SJI45_11135 [Streptomyces sp. S399]GFH65302.1 hypothetical protein Srut_18160 [Streptomyces rutgersensis]SUP62093.1 Uncharacterised protein [Streptomyces griseus]
MPVFPRFPEWQQHSGRGTVLRDAVLTVRQLGRFDFNRKHLTRIDHALVFSTSREEEYEAYHPPHRPSRAEVAAKRYSSAYEVDMGVQLWCEAAELPSADDGFPFRLEADLTWQVVEPARYVRSRVRDVPALLTGELLRLARPVTRRFREADCAAAEEELREVLRRTGEPGGAAGLQTGWVLRLHRDEAVIAHHRRLRGIDHAVAERIRADVAGTAADRHQHDRELRQDQLSVARAHAYGEHAQELALQQQRWAHEQALAAHHQQLELQRLNHQKIEYYEHWLSKGGVTALAFRLAEHPEDMRLVMENMRQDQLHLIRSQIHVIEEVLKGDQLEGYELEGPKKQAIQAMADLFGQRLPGVPHEPLRAVRPPGEPRSDGEAATPASLPYVPPPPEADPAPPGLPAPPGGSASPREADRDPHEDAGPSGAPGPSHPYASGPPTVPPAVPLPQYVSPQPWRTVPALGSAPTRTEPPPWQPQPCHGTAPGPQRPPFPPPAPPDASQEDTAP